MLSFGTGTIGTEALLSPEGEAVECLSLADQADVLVRLTTRPGHENDPLSRPTCYVLACCQSLLR